MTQNIYKGDEDGLLADAEYTERNVVLTGLTPEQTERITAAVAEALRDGSRTGKIAGKVATLAVLMVFVAAALWVVAFIVSSLPTN